MSKFISFCGEIAVDPSRVDECMEAFERWFDEFCEAQSYSHVGHPMDESADERAAASLARQRG